MKLKIGTKPKAAEPDDDGDLGYTPLDMNYAREKAKEVAESNETDFLELKEGTNYLRMLPTWKGAKRGWPMREVWQHTINSDDIAALTGRKKPDRGRFSVICLLKEGRKACPVCEYIDQLEQQGGKTALSLAREIEPRMRVFANATLIATQGARSGTTEKGTGAPKLWGFGKGIRDKLVGFMEGKNPQLGDRGIDFTHPKSGRNIIVTRTGTNKQTRYPVVKLGDIPSPLDLTKIKIRNLDSYVEEQLLDYDDMREELETSTALLVGGMESAVGDEMMAVEGEEETEPEKPRKKLRIG